MRHELCGTHTQNSNNITASLDVEVADHIIDTSYIKIEQAGIEINTGQTSTSFNYGYFAFDLWQ